MRGKRVMAFMMFFFLVVMAFIGVGFESAKQIYEISLIPFLTSTLALFGGDVLQEREKLRINRGLVDSK